MGAEQKSDEKLKPVDGSNKMQLHSWEPNFWWIAENILKYICYKPTIQSILQTNFQ